MVRLVLLGVWCSECPFRQDKFPLPATVSHHHGTLKRWAQAWFVVPSTRFVCTGLSRTVVKWGRTEGHTATFTIFSGVKSSSINFRGKIPRDEIVWPGPPVLPDSSR